MPAIQTTRHAGRCKVKALKYKRPESSKAELLRTIHRLFKHNLALQRELHPWREFKKAILSEREASHD